ncbi:MFS transporter [Paraliomyxa miuraensis]|uniref:MFS transporter n=1 Tax=Paraliomyxa miuraensis TaxID=376150 RepID=UPI002254AC36|nr:MFS transporter [Paraliomyxa miuraensis]MCX4247853.1 MFS transporter [Paraliomyxa miuraensis]
MPASLPLRTRLAYGAPNLGLALVGIPILVYLPRFYSDVVGISVAWLGVVFVAGRVIDAVTDPLVGVLSDRSRSIHGRRRPWILWGCLPLALLSVALYVPPKGLSDTMAAALASLVILGWFLAYTAVNVPYRALGPELSDDYDERTALFSIREGSLVVGTLIAAVGPGAIGLALGLDGGLEVVDDAAERRRFAIYGAIAAPALVLTCLLCVRRVQERFGGRSGDAPDPIPAAPPPSPSAVRQQLRDAFSNRPFVILLLAFVVIAIGSSLPTVLISYFLAYWLGASHLLPLFLLVYLGVGLCCLPGWVWLSRRRGKKVTWLAAMAVNAGFFGFVSLLGPGQVLEYGILVAFSGIGGVAVLAMPYAMQADVIDHDELRTGERREGLYGGLWSIAEKSAAGLGLGLSMLTLDAVGYRPNQAQSPLVLDVLRVLYIGVPCICTAIGFWIARKYPLDREAHQAIAAELTRSGSSDTR